MARGQDAATRFLSRVDCRGSDECWPWRGGKLPNGYGAFWLGSNNTGAHRAAYRLFVGEIPAGLVVRHSCDNKECVNPAHLTLGSQAQNIADKVGRGRQARGESHGNARYTEDCVARIRAAFALGRRQASISFCAGAERTFVWRVVHGVSWPHVDSEGAVI